MLLRRYHKVEEEKIPFDDIPQLKHPLTEEVGLEELIEVVEDDLYLEELTVKALTEIALEKGIEDPKKIKKEDLIKLIREGQYVRPLQTKRHDR